MLSDLRSYQLFRLQQPFVGALVAIPETLLSNDRYRYDFPASVSVTCPNESPTILLSDTEF